MKSKRTRKIERRLAPMKVRKPRIDYRSTAKVGKMFSMSPFLKKVFEKEVADGFGHDRKPLVNAVHGVMIESGFVRYDSVSGTITDTIHVPDQWSSHGLTTSFYYTLPEIFGDGCYAFDEAQTVVLTFQRVGYVVRIKGHCLGKNMCQLYEMVLNEEQLALFAWANCGGIDGESGKNWYPIGTYPEKKVLEFLKNVKGKMAIRLLIDLSEEAGLAPPSCFMLLPADLKLRILVLLHDELKRKRKRKKGKNMGCRRKYQIKNCARERILLAQSVARRKY